MSEKFDIEKEIKELHEKYAYWFELFKRSSNPIEKQDAKKKYKEYIERIIELQNKYNLKEKDDILCKHAWDYDAALSLKEKASMWRCRFCHRTGQGTLDMHGDPAFEVEAEPKKRKIRQKSLKILKYWGFWKRSQS